MIQSLSRLRSCSFKPVLLVITVWNVRLRLFPSRPQLIVPCHCDQSLPGMFRCWYKWRPPARNLFVAFNSWENRLQSPFYAQALARAVVLRAWFVAMLLRKRKSLKAEMRLQKFRTRSRTDPTKRGWDGTGNAAILQSPETAELAQSFDASGNPDSLGLELTNLRCPSVPFVCILGLGPGC